MAQAPFNTIRAEIRAHVEAAKRANKPITSQIIWGLMSREVPEDGFASVLSSMCGRHQLVQVVAPAALIAKQPGARPACYEPGPVDVPDAQARDRASRAMGNMAHKRLREARSAARKWARS